MKAHATRSGFTLVEALIAAAVMAIVGGVLYFLANTALVLYSKNTAVNFAHQQLRNAITMMDIDLHEGISTPKLINSSLATTTRSVLVRS